MDPTQQKRESKKSRRREIRKRRKANILYLHATSKLKMKISKVPSPDSNEGFTSDQSNLKNDNKVNSTIGINSTDELKNTDTKNKDQVPSRNNDTNTNDNKNNDTAPSEPNANASILNSAKTKEKAIEMESSNLDSLSSTVTLLAKNIECIRAGNEYIINTYSDNSDLDSLKPSNLTVENVNARRNGSCDTIYVDPYKDDKDNSSSSCSSPNHAQAELEDDSADMVLRISEDENISAAPSPVPASNDHTLLNKSDQVDEDSSVNNTITESVTNANSSNKAENKKNTIVSTANKELSTDKCSSNSDDNFDDLINNMSSKQIELAKNKNHGVTVSDLRKEIEDCLNTDNSDIEEVSAKIIHKITASFTHKYSSDANNKKQRSETVIKTLGSNDKVGDKCEENEKKEESDIEDASGSTIDSRVSSRDTDPNSNDADDEKCRTESEEFSSIEINISTNKRDALPMLSENTPELYVEPEITEPVIMMQSTSDTDESACTIYTFRVPVNNKTSDSDKQIITNTEVDSGLKSNGILVHTEADKNDLTGDNGDEVNNCNGDEVNNGAVVNDTKSDDVNNGDKGLKLRLSLKRLREINEDLVDLKKQKISESRVENEQEIPKNDPASEKIKPVSEVQKKKKVPDSELSAKRLFDKQIDEVAKRLKMEFNFGIRKTSGSKLGALKELMVRRGIQKVSKKGLEEFVVQKICEALNHTSRVAEMAEEIKLKDIAMEAMRMKFGSVNKQVADLDIVQSRISSEMRKAKDPREVVPVKITRSVGLQVSLQPLKAKTPVPVPAPTTPEPLPPPVVTGTPVKKKTPRTSAAANRAAMLPPPPPALTPAPSHIRPPPVPTGKGIKTILPKVSSNAEARDGPSSLLGNILQKSPTLSSSPTPSSPRKSTGDTVKVIDLTDEDDSNRSSAGSSPSTSGNIRVVASHQLTNTTPDASIVTTNMPRLTYLVQPGQQGQQVLLATTNAPTKPGQARPTLMFKPVVPQGTQKLNLVRPANNVSNAVAVLPSNTAGVCKYVTTTYTPGQLTRSPTQTTRAIAPAPRHPAPLPGPPAVQPSQPSWKLMPPKPSLKITLVGDGIVLSWRILNKDMTLYEEIASYQLYAYQETNAPPTTEMWRKVGDVRALALPMACTLTQFTDGNKYHFAVRGVDVKSRVGPFSTPEQITLPAQQ